MMRGMQMMLVMISMGRLFLVKSKFCYFLELDYV